MKNLNALQAKRQTLVEEISQLTKHLTVLDTLTAKYEILAAEILLNSIEEIAELYADAGITDTDGCLVPPPPPRATDVLTEDELQ